MCGSDHIKNFTSEATVKKYMRDQANIIIKQNKLIKIDANQLKYKHFDTKLAMLQLTPVKRHVHVQHFMIKRFASIWLLLV